MAKGKLQSPASEVTQCHFLHILLTKASHRANPDQEQGMRKRQGLFATEHVGKKPSLSTYPTIPRLRPLGLQDVPAALSLPLPKLPAETR